MSREKIFKEQLRGVYIKLLLRRGISSSGLKKAEHDRSYLAKNLKPDEVKTAELQAVNYLNQEEPGWIPPSDSS